MKRVEFYQKAKSYTDCEMAILIQKAIKSKHDQLEAIMAIANDCDINDALKQIGKEERLTGR